MSRAVFPKAQQSVRLLAAFSGLLVATPASYAQTGDATEGLVACFSPGSDTAAGGKVIGPKQATEALDALAKSNAELAPRFSGFTLQGEVSMPEAPLMVGALGRTLIMYDKDVSMHNGVRLGQTAVLIGFDDTNTSGCEVLAPQVVCAAEENPEFSVACE